MRSGLGKFFLHLGIYRHTWVDERHEGKQFIFVGKQTVPAGYNKLTRKVSVSVCTDQLQHQGSYYAIVAKVPKYSE
jgi:hypothetical protein